MLLEGVILILHWTDVSDFRRAIREWLNVSQGHEGSRRKTGSHNISLLFPSTPILLSHTKPLVREFYYSSDVEYFSNKFFFSSVFFLPIYRIIPCNIGRVLKRHLITEDESVTNWPKVSLILLHFCSRLVTSSLSSTLHIWLSAVRILHLHELNKLVSFFWYLYHAVELGSLLPTEGPRLATIRKNCIHVGK